jgi:hypothetical protein
MLPGFYTFGGAHSDSKLPTEELATLFWTVWPTPRVQPRASRPNRNTGGDDPRIASSCDFD